VTVGPPSGCASSIARRQQAAIYANPQAHKGPVSREKKSAATTIRTQDLGVVFHNVTVGNAGSIQHPYRCAKRKRLVCKTVRSYIALTYIAQDRAAVTLVIIKYNKQS
jgi:hypothetical protein